MLASLLIMVVPTALMVAGMLLVRRRLAPAGGFLNAVPAAGDIFGAAGTGLAVVLGFVIFLSFGSYQTARDDSGTEAVAVQQMYDVSGFFQQPVRDELRARRSATAEPWSTGSGPPWRPAAPAPRSSSGSTG